MSCLKRFKTDGTPVSSNHILYAAPALTNFLSSFFTAILRHGYMPKALADCIFVPSLKSNKDSTSSDNYWPIALAPNLSKILEWCILQCYGSFLSTSDLQLDLSLVSRRIFAVACSRMLSADIIEVLKSLPVFWMLVRPLIGYINHANLFQLMMDRKLPTAVIRFLFLWYSTQELTVRWNASFSSSINVSTARWSYFSWSWTNSFHYLYKWQKFHKNN